MPRKTLHLQNSTEPSAPPADSVEGQPDAKPLVAQTSPEAGANESWMIWFLGAADVHPYVAIHFLITCILFSWVSLGLEFSAVLTRLLPPLMAYLSAESSLTMGWIVARVWTLSSHWQDRLPVMAAFVFLLLVGVPAFYGAVLYFTGNHLGATIMFSVVALEIIWAMVKGVTSLLRWCSCQQGDMPASLHSAWREAARKLFGACIAFAVIYAVMVFNGIREHNTAVFQLENDRRLFFHDNLPHVLSQFNAMRCAMNESTLTSLQEHEMVAYITNKNANSTHLAKWAALLEQEEKLKLFSPWVSFSYSVGKESTSVADFISKDVTKQANQVMPKLSLVWAGLLVCWYLFFLPLDIKKQPIAEIALNCMYSFLASLLIEFIVLSYIWEPVAGTVDDIFANKSWIPAWSVWGGLTTVGVLTLFKKAGCLCCSR